MSLTAQIGSSELSFKLAQKLVASLAEKFAFSFEDGWNTISNRTVENVQKRLKREKRRANPTSAIKHPRTAFSFFTQKQRPVCQAAHPEATFGQLSRFVSEGWKALTPAQMADFKALETADKARYQVERDVVLAKVAAETGSAPAVVADVPVVAEATSKKARKPKSATATPVDVAPVVVASTTDTPATGKRTKTPKAAAVVAVVEAVPAPTPVAEKKPKTPKASKAATAEVVAPVVAEVVVAPVVAKAAKVAKPKTGKA
jgi:hypothetical protein